MIITTEKNGRPRRYRIAPYGGYADASIAALIAALEELTARVYDQIEDLPPEVLAFVPTNSYLSIGLLALHMADGECGWMRSLHPMELPARLETTLAYGKIRTEGPDTPTELLDADTLIEIWTAVRERITLPIARHVENADENYATGRALTTPREVLHHLLWHTTYHSGQIGSIRLEAGSEYTWTFE